MDVTVDSGPIEPHAVHSERLLEHAAEQLELGDRLQASEKAWGAAAHRLKVFTDRRGWDYGNHQDAHRAIRRIVQETGDGEIRKLFDIASGLHQNYYIDTKPLDSLAANHEDVRGSS